MNHASGRASVEVSEVEVIAPNFKRRLSGVTSTIVQLVPVQRRSVRIATLGPGLPANLPKLRWRQVGGLLRRPWGRPFRIWHARRNVEMLAGLFLREVARAPLKLVFTSAAQRHHKAFTRWLIRRMDRVIATSSRSGSFLEVAHVVVMHGIDLERFSPVEDVGDKIAVRCGGEGPVVGCFGRVRHQKGTDLFVQAMLELLPQHPDWKAVVTGRVTVEHRSFADTLESRIAESGLSDRILFLGEVPDIRPWYRRVSLYVAPSRNEGFGLTPLEAMACGTPVVASDAGAYAEMIVEGVTGSVVPAGKQDELTAAIGRWMRDPEGRAAAAKAARSHVERNFPLEREASGVFQVYQGLWDAARQGNTRR